MQRPLDWDADGVRGGCPLKVVREKEAERELIPKISAFW
uniref:Uncharacterized protein n=1 Tax=Rhizophora mucronata TaxID=61149 RepID=A0A2P2JAV0_RHIMU